MKRAILFLIILFANSSAFAVCRDNIVPTTPTSRFIVNSDGTAIDTLTGLMWKRCHEGKIFDDAGTPLEIGDDFCADDPGAVTFRWQEALQRAVSLNDSGGYAGYTNWRVPNVKELASLVERSCNRANINDPINPINQVVFPSSGPIRWYWSSTQFTYGTTSPSATGVNFSGGYEEAGYKTEQAYLRLVRDIR